MWGKDGAWYYIHPFWAGNVVIRVCNCVSYGFGKDQCDCKSKDYIERNAQPARK